MTSTADTDTAADDDINFEGSNQNAGGLVIDLNEIEDSSFEAIPRGVYPCIVAALNFEYSQNSGNPMWTWELEVSEGDYAGRKLFFHTVWAGKGLPRTKKIIAELMPELFEGPFNPEEVAGEGRMLGINVRARVDIRMYEGEKRNNVKNLMKAAEGGSDFL